MFDTWFDLTTQKVRVLYSYTNKCLEKNVCLAILPPSNGTGVSIVKALIWLSVCPFIHITKKTRYLPVALSLKIRISIETPNVFVCFPQNLDPES